MAVAEALEMAKRAIEAYTGLSPAAFCTVLAVAAALYCTVAAFLAPPPPPPRKRVAEPLPPTVQLGEVTEEELRAYDGSDPKKPLLMAIKGQIYDVSKGRMFYGPGGPYALFAGKDASRALAKMSFEPKDLIGDTSGLGSFELDALQDWEYKFMSKYEQVGTIKKTVAEGSDGSTTEITEKSTLAADSAEEQVGRSEETKQDGPAETSANAEHSAESKVEGALDHGDEAKQQAELKEIGLSGHSVEADHSGESKDTDAGEDAKE